MNKELLIFDLDGTLYKTHKVSVPALKRAFSKFDISLTKEDIIGQFGEPTEIIIKNLTPDDKLEHLKEIKNEIASNEERMIPLKAELYQGVKETLCELKDNGYVLAICSNGRRDYIEAVLKATAIYDDFSSIKSYTRGKDKADHIEELKEEFSRDRAVMIGDRYHDIEAAEEVGITSIGARYGYGGKEMEKADFVVSEPSEILSVVREGLG